MVKTKFSIFNFQFSTKQGFALLFAMFVSSIMLSVGLGISNVIYKELVLSGIGRESEFSFYTAQTGLECAEYLNSTDPGVFPTTTGDRGTVIARDLCDRALISAENSVSEYSYNYSFDISGGTTKFRIRITHSGLTMPDMCANVSVKKGIDNYLTIESRGYNTCDDNNPRRVERSLKMVTYIRT